MKLKGLQKVGERVRREGGQEREKKSKKRKTRTRRNLHQVDEGYGGFQRKIGNLPSTHITENGKTVLRNDFCNITQMEQSPPRA